MKQQVPKKEEKEKPSSQAEGRKKILEKKHMTGLVFLVRGFCFT
jgi:hypothetical protein